MLGELAGRSAAGDDRAWRRLFPTLTEPLSSRPAARRRLVGGSRRVGGARRAAARADVLAQYFDGRPERGIIATDALIGTFAGFDDESLRQ